MCAKHAAVAIVLWPTNVRKISALAAMELHKSQMIRLSVLNMIKRSVLVAVQVTGLRIRSV